MQDDQDPMKGFSRAPLSSSSSSSSPLSALLSTLLFLHHTSSLASLHHAFHLLRLRFRPRLLHPRLRRSRQARRDARLSRRIRLRDWRRRRPDSADFGGGESAVYLPCTLLHALTPPPLQSDIISKLILKRDETLASLGGSVEEIIGDVDQTLQTLEGASPPVLPIGPLTRTDFCPSSPVRHRVQTQPSSGPGLCPHLQPDLNVFLSSLDTIFAPGSLFFLRHLPFISSTVSMQRPGLCYRNPP